MPVRVTFKDRGLVSLVDTLKQIRNLKLSVGFQGPEGRRKYGDTDINVATAATFAEFGTASAPERSFIRSTMFQNKKVIKEKIAAETANVMFGDTDAVTALENIGAFVVGLIEDKIRRAREWAAPNAPSVVEQKGFDFPLHDTFVLSRSVTWTVRDVSGNVISSGGSSG